MRWFILLSLLPVSIAAQTLSASDLDAILSAGRTSPRFADLIATFAGVNADVANERRIARLREQIQQLSESLDANRMRQAEIANSLARGETAFRPEQLASRREAAIAELRVAVARLRYLSQLTAWVQSGGANEPTFSVEELENTPPQQTWEEIRQLTARIRELHRRIVNPGELSASERANVILMLSQEQVLLTSSEKPLAAAVAMLQDHLQRALDQPPRVPPEVRAAVQANRDAIQSLIDSPR